MAKNLPQQIKGWLQLLKTGWPEITLQKDQVDTLIALTHFYMSADQEERRMIRSHITNGFSDQLISFVHRAAEETVQLRDNLRLTKGLAALGIGSDTLDPRDVIIALSLLAHSGAKLGVEWRPLFEEAIEFAGADFQEQIKDFLARDTEDRSIYEMGYKESQDRTGFKYIRHGDF